MTLCVETQIDIQADCTKRRDASIRSALRAGIKPEKIRRQFQVSERHMRALAEQLTAERVSA
jgi:hypothetical protein